jgi:hypothetical protein
MLRIVSAFDKLFDAIEAQRDQDWQGPIRSCSRLVGSHEPVAPAIIAQRRIAGRGLILQRDTGFLHHLPEFLHVGFEQGGELRG